MSDTFVDILDYKRVEPEGFVDILSDKPLTTPVAKPVEEVLPTTTPLPLGDVMAGINLNAPSILPTTPSTINEIDIDAGLRELGRVGPMTTPSIPEWEEPSIPKPVVPGASGAERSWAEPTVMGAVGKSVRAFNAGFTGDLTTLIPEQEIGEAYEWENVPVGMSYAAGLILGPGKIVKPVTKLLASKIPALMLRGTEGLLTRTIKTMAKEVPGMAAFGTISAIGEAAKQKNWDDALDVLWTGTKGGALMGLTFAGTRGVFWKPVKDRIKRIAFGMALLDLERGTDPWDDRDFWVKVKDYSIDTYFLWGGLNNAFEGLEKELNQRIKDRKLEETVKKTLKKDEEKTQTDLESNPYYKLSDMVVQKDAELERPDAVQEWARREKIKAESAPKEDIPDLGPEEVKIEKAKDGKVSKDGNYLKEARKLKKKLGKEKYETILQGLGLEKANQVMNKKSKTQVLDALKEGLEEVKPDLTNERIIQPKEVIDEIAKTPESEGVPIESPKMKKTKKAKAKVEEVIEPDEGTLVAEEAKAAEREAFERELEEPKEVEDEETLKYFETLIPDVEPSEKLIFNTKTAAGIVAKRMKKEGKAVEVAKNEEGKYEIREVVEEPEKLEDYANRVGKTSQIKTISLIGSSVKGKGKDTDIIYDFGEREIPKDAEEFVTDLIESSPNMNLDLYDTFIKINNRYFHVSSGAGREVIENTEYGKEQEGKPTKNLFTSESTEPFGEKIPIEESIRPETSEDANETRRSIADRVKRFRAGENFDLDELEREAEYMSISIDESAFKESWEYDQFNELNDTLLDLIRKVREEKGIKRKTEEPSREEKEDWEILLEEEGMPDELDFEKEHGFPHEGAEGEMTFDFMGGQQIYENLGRVWHGTRRKFDRFSDEHIGTGEGFQAYGWGHYFTSSKKHNLLQNRIL